MLIKIEDGGEYYLQTEDSTLKLTTEKIGNTIEYFSDEIIGIDLYCWPCIDGFGVQHKYETPKDCLIDLVQNCVDKTDIAQYVNDGKSNLEIRFIADKWELWKKNTATVMERDKVPEFEKVAAAVKKETLENLFLNNLWNEHLIILLLECTSTCVVPLYKICNEIDMPFTVVKQDVDVEQIGYAVCDLDSFCNVEYVDSLETLLHWIDIEIDSNYVTEAFETYSYKLEEQVDGVLFSLIDYQEGPFIGDDPEENGMLELIGDEWLYATKIKPE